jgi:hypothetical protein
MKTRIITLIALFGLSLIAFITIPPATSPSQSTATPLIIPGPTASSPPRLRHKSPIYKNFDELFKARDTVIDPSRAEVEAYLEKNNYSKTAYISAFAALLQLGTYDCHFLYEGLSRHPHDPDLWHLLICNEKLDSEKLFQFLEKNPAIPQNLAITNIWKANYHAQKDQFLDNLSYLEQIDPSAHKIHGTYVTVNQAIHDIYSQLGYSDDNIKIKILEKGHSFIKREAESEHAREINYRLREEAEKTENQNNEPLVKNLKNLQIKMFQLHQEIYPSRGENLLWMLSEASDLLKMNGDTTYGDTGMTVRERLVQLNDPFQKSIRENAIRMKISELEKGPVFDEFFKMIRTEAYVDFVPWLEKNLGHLVPPSPESLLDPKTL